MMRRSMTWSRRELLGSLALAPLVRLTGAPPPEPLDVVIVGGGLAGLALARRLQQQKRSFVVLEGARRCGGRVLTLREGLPVGLRPEAGAERVPPGHRRLQGLLAELGLRTVPYRLFEDPVVLHANERRFAYRGPDDLGADELAALPERERRHAPFFLHLLYAKRGPPPGPDDPRSGLQWLRDQGLSPAGERWLRAFSIHPLERMSAEFLHAAALRDLEASAAELIEGGSDRLTRALEAEVAAHVRRGTEVVGLGFSPSGVRVATAGGAVLPARVGVLCLPFRRLARMRFEGGMPEALSRVLAGLRPAPEVKLHWSLPVTAVTGARGIPAATYRTSFPASTWRLPEESEGQVMMNAMAANDDVAALHRHLPRGKTLDEVLQRHAADVFPPGAHAVSHDFPEDPWIGAAYPYVAQGCPGSTGVLSAGPLLIAGGDLSRIPGWMEGALESADEAALACESLLGRAAR